MHVWWVIKKCLNFGEVIRRDLKVWKVEGTVILTFLEYVLLRMLEQLDLYSS